MRKGLLYWLPILAVTQVGASMPETRTDHHPIHPSTITEEGSKEAPTVIDGTINVSPRPIAGRNASGRHIVEEVPRAGRNVTRRPDGRMLIPRN